MAQAHEVAGDAHNHNAFQDFVQHTLLPKLCVVGCHISGTNSKDERAMEVNAEKVPTAVATPEVDMASHIPPLPKPGCHNPSLCCN